MSRFLSEKYAALEPYVPGEQPRDRRYIKLNTNESPFPPSPKAQAYAAEAAKTLQLYSDPDCTALVRKAAALWGVKEEQVYFGNGSDEVLYFAFLSWCDSRTPAVFADITYGFYKVFAQFLGIPFTCIPLKEDFSIDPADYYAAGGTVFIANPNAPTGLALTLEQLKGILEANRDNVVVIDEAYIDFGGESAVKLIDTYENLLVVQTFSKSRSLAGGRLGMAFGSSALIADLKALKFSTNPFNVNAMTMAAGLGALEDEAYTRENCRRVMENRAFITQALRALSFTLADSQTNFVLARHSRLDGRALYLALKDRGILVRHFPTPRLSPYIRITVGTRQEMEALLAAITDILEETP